VDLSDVRTERLGHVGGGVLGLSLFQSFSSHFDPWCLV